MSFVVCVATTDNIIIVGDTQTNTDQGPTDITATKVFSIGENTLVGITGKYQTYIETVNARMTALDVENASFNEKVDYVKTMIRGKENNAVIAGVEDGKVKLVVMGNKYGYDDSIINVEAGAEVKVLLPPEITMEMCKPFISSLDNLKSQVINCIKQISRLSDTVNDKVFGLETDGEKCKAFTSGIEYSDITIRIE